jgi:hypothetical protein
MALTAGVANSYKQEIMQGIHSSSDTYMVALYQSSSSVGPTSTAYTTSGEASGTGYVAGGLPLAGFSVTGTSIARLDFNQVSWPGATITARGAMIYNASKGNRAVAVLDFGSDIQSVNGTFTFVPPAVGDTTSLVRIA